MSKVTLPPFLYEIADRLRTQDNRITSHPMFCVQQRRDHYNDVDDDSDADQWFFKEDWSKADDETSAILDGLHEASRYSGDDDDERDDVRLSEWKRMCVRYEWETVMVAFTEGGCQEYLSQNGHNLSHPRIYVDTFNRCPEMVQLREWLMALHSLSKQRAARKQPKM